MDDGHGVANDVALALFAAKEAIREAGPPRDEDAENRGVEEEG